jgi:hydroxyacylglutathione hydrolase
MYYHQRHIPGLSIYSYLIGDESTRQALVIDPTRDIDYFLNLARENDLTIRHVLETHVHADFVSGAAEFKARLDGEVSVHVSGEGGAEWTPPYAGNVMHNGDSFTMGPLRIEALHTPGHTYEHVSWALYDTERSDEVPWMLFTGDFLFVGDVGRPDLLGQEAQKTLAHQLYKSVFEVLPALPDFTEIFPAHGAGSLCGKALGGRGASTLGFERRFNPALQPAPEAEWIAHLLEGMPLAPPYFPRMKQVNARGPVILGPGGENKPVLCPRKARELADGGALIIDTRPKEAFAGAHIQGSLNIPLDASLATWAGWVVPYDRPLLLVTERPADLPNVVVALQRIGLDNVAGAIDRGIDGWSGLGQKLESITPWSAEAIGQSLNAAPEKQPFLLDVRTEREYDGGHVPGSVNIHAGQIRERVGEIPKDRPVAVLCAGGYRAAVATSILRSEGIRFAAPVIGGVNGYAAAGNPLVETRAVA